MAFGAAGKRLVVGLPEVTRTACEILELVAHGIARLRR